MALGIHWQLNKHQCIKEYLQVVSKAIYEPWMLWHIYFYNMMMYVTCVAVVRSAYRWIRDSEYCQVYRVTSKDPYLSFLLG